MHHEWVSPISISQYYCHPVEHFFLNCFAVAIGPALLGRHCGNHIIVAWVWYFLVIIASANVHSGYHLPFTNSSEEHDFHHSRYADIYQLLHSASFYYVGSIRTMVLLVYLITCMVLVARLESAKSFRDIL